MTDWTIPTPDPVATRELEPPCRCGHRDQSPRGIKPRDVDPIADLRGQDVDLTSNTFYALIECRSCHHPVTRGSRAIVVPLEHEYRSRCPHYHPTCARI